MSLRNEIAKIVKAGLDDYFCEVVANEYDVTDQILALIDAERCVWKKENNGINVYLTSCNMIEVFEGYTYCPKCGKKIEVSPS